MRRRPRNHEIALEPGEPRWLLYRSTGYVENWRLARLRKWEAFKRDRINQLRVDRIRAAHQKHLKRRRPKRQNLKRTP